MIGSFWNLCRACPSMPIDKQLHSEYRSTYTWHEYTGPHQENTVVRRAPQSQPNSTKQASAKLQSAKSTEDENTEGPTLEPPLPRRKKCPELAYRHHEFISNGNGGGIDAVDTNIVVDKVREVTGSSNLPASQLSKAISRISTEYRLQFAWPRRAQLTNGDTISQLPAAGGASGNSGGPPRKSLSMGALKQGIGQTGPAPVHVKKRPGDLDHKRDGIQASELEPLFANNTDTIDGIVPEGEEHDEQLNELKLNFRSATKEEKDKENIKKIAPVTNTMPPAGRPSSVQARPISGILQEDFNTDNERAMARARKDFLFRHHLDRTTGVGDGALLPSPTREKLEPVVPRRRDESKEPRDDVQSKTKSSPKNSPRTGRSQSLGPLSRSPKRQTPRAPSVNKDTKEKEKEHKDKETRDKSGEPARHPRPMVSGRVRWSIRESPYSSKKSPVTMSSKSQPLIPPLPPPPSGPTTMLIHKKPSPKPQRKPFLATTAIPHRPLHHHAKPTSTTTTSTTSTTSSIINKKKNQMIIPLIKNTTQQCINGNSGTSSLSSGNALSSSSKYHSLKKNKINSNNNSNNSNLKKIQDNIKVKNSAIKSQITNIDSSKSSIDKRIKTNHANAVLSAMTAEPQINGETTVENSSIASTPPSQSVTVPIQATAVITSSPWFDDEPVVKSPPEPTRVKSPEQMIMRSPEPVNWTVPLDTGKTFTVTQNVREGELLMRPHSEAKTWATQSINPSAPQSAPPELAHQHKSHQHSQHSGYKSPESESVSLGSFSGLNGHKDLDSIETESPLPSNIQDSSTPTQSDKDSIILLEEPQKDVVIKPVAGTNLRCLEDPIFEFERGKNDTVSTTTTTPAPTVPGTGYRVLEAEDTNILHGSGTGGISSGYHVLEAPNLSPGSTQRTATDVLEMARNRFDKFWGKNGSDSQA
ncbi:probable serine/threonine-protein kinase DDB_G0267686 isoform X12 [Aphidius gifuensis]|uniref:probable serine/threonine-protein kinase DDB_G0267686 isoform X12 n=1 Tax=Aphidius gifuensis TaxID=684658 RepID=UPI001CDCAF7D|nr:probable serine/threonine-protein kinase DDB_G0267686 isoform X12 [Aphidius gifuensis]